MTKEIVEAVGVLEREKGISADRLMAALEDALLSAYKKTPEAAKYARVEVDRSSGDFRVYELILPSDLEEQLLDEVEEEAGEPTVDPETGELVYPEPPEIDQERLMQYRDQIDERDVTPEDFGRIAAQTAKQVILQRIREAERDMMFTEYQDRVGELITGIVQQSDSRYTLVQLRERVEALLPRGEQVHGERYDHGQRIKAIITDVSNQAKGPSIIVSRRSPELIRSLFELEVPEIADGLVEIQNVAREPGYRSKIAVVSHASGVDPVGACVGPRGSRVRMVVSELRGEKIDIIPFNEEPARFVAKALSPARVREVLVDDEAKQATVIVPDDQLSLAIGKDGLNARLAARLTGWRVDIRSETEFAEEEAEMGYAEEEVAGRCAAILANGKRCPNASLPGSRYCGLPAHQALVDQETDYVVPPEEGDEDGEAPVEEAAADEAAAVEESLPVEEAAPGEEPSEEELVEDADALETEAEVEDQPAAQEVLDAEDAAEVRARRAPSAAEPAGGRGVVDPLRRCISCRRSLPKSELLRLVRGADGEVRVDLAGKAEGRGAYVCDRPECAESVDCRQTAGTRLSGAGNSPTGDHRLSSRMAKKRVHEIAKERGITSKEALEVLRKAGLDVKVAASSVEEEEAARAFGNGAGASAPAPAEEAPRREGERRRRRSEGRRQSGRKAERQAEGRQVRRRQGRRPPLRPAAAASRHPPARGRARAPRRPRGARPAHPPGRPPPQERPAAPRQGDRGPRQSDRAATPGPGRRRRLRGPGPDGGPSGGGGGGPRPARGGRGEAGRRRWRRPAPPRGDRLAGRPARPDPAAPAVPAAPPRARPQAPPAVGRARSRGRGAGAGSRRSSARTRPSRSARAPPSRRSPSRSSWAPPR